MQIQTHHLSKMLLCVRAWAQEKIVFGGGVMKRECLFPKIRAHVQSMLNGYVQVDQILTDQIDEYIVSSDYGNDAGLIGALALGEYALQQQATPKL